MGLAGIWNSPQKSCSLLCETVTQDRCVDVCIESHNIANGCEGGARLAVEDDDDDKAKTLKTDDKKKKPAKKTVDRCNRRRVRRLLRKRRAALKAAQKTAAACGDEDKKCVDSAYRGVVRAQRRISRFKRWYKKSCSLGDLFASVKKTSRCRGRAHRSWLRRQRKRKQRLHKRAAACPEDDRGCTKRVLARIARVNKRIKARQRRCARKNGAKKGVKKGGKKGRCSRFPAFLKKMRARRAKLHKESDKCRDDAVCVQTVKEKIVDLNKRILRRRALCRRHAKKKCASRSFVKFARSQRALRKKWQLKAEKCSDEDVTCVDKAMNRIIKINKRIEKRRRTCLKKETKLVPAGSYKSAVTHIVTVSAWKHALSCEDMRAGWAKWLKWMRAERQRLHDSACKCSSRDLQCLHERFARIKQVQRTIRSSRDEYTALVTKCDACAPIRLRFVRWVKLQNARRHRLHQEICKCPEDDPQCVTSRAARIKMIQQRIKDGRKHIFHLNEHCQADDDLIPSSSGEQRAVVATPSDSAPAPRIASASALSALFAVVLSTMLALLLL